MSYRGSICSSKIFAIIGVAFCFLILSIKTTNIDVTVTDVRGSDPILYTLSNVNVSEDSDAQAVNTLKKMLLFFPDSCFVLPLEGSNIVKCYRICSVTLSLVDSDKEILSKTSNDIPKKRCEYLAWILSQLPEKSGLNKIKNDLKLFFPCQTFTATSGGAIYDTGSYQFCNLSQTKKHFHQLVNQEDTTVTTETSTTTVTLTSTTTNTETATTNANVTDSTTSANSTNVTTFANTTEFSTSVNSSVSESSTVNSETTPNIIILDHPIITHGPHLRTTKKDYNPTTKNVVGSLSVGELLGILIGCLSVISLIVLVTFMIIRSRQ